MAPAPAGADPIAFVIAQRVELARRVARLMDRFDQAARERDEMRETCRMLAAMLPPAGDLRPFPVAPAPPDRGTRERVNAVRARLVEQAHTED